MMWNPPWLLIVMAPVLAFPFVFSNLLWLVLNVCFVVLALNIYCRANDQELPENKALLFSALFLFFPLINCLLLGQIACLLTLLVSILYYGLRKGNDLFVGISWFFLTVKPHLFLFLSVYLLLIILKSGRYKILLYALISSIGALLITAIINAQVIWYWLDAHVLGVNIEEVAGVNNHKTTTVVYAIQTILYRMNYGVHNWPFIVVPLVPLIFYILYIKNSSTKNLISSQQFNLSLILSFMFSPFAWIFDFVPLIFVCFDTIKPYGSLINYRTWINRGAYLYLLLNLISFFLDFFPSVGLHYYVYYNFCVLAFWCLMQVDMKSLKKT